MALSPGDKLRVRQELLMLDQLIFLFCDVAMGLAADRLGLVFEHHHVGLGALEPAVVSITRRKDVA